MPRTASSTTSAMQARSTARGGRQAGHAKRAIGDDRQQDEDQHTGPADAQRVLLEGEAGLQQEDQGERGRRPSRATCQDVEQEEAQDR